MTNFRRVVAPLVPFLALSLFSNPLRAQATGTQAPPAATSTQAAADSTQRSPVAQAFAIAKSDTSVPHVRSVDGPVLPAGLRDRISIHVDHFPELLNETGGNCSAIVLFLDGAAIEGLTPEACDAVNGVV